MSSSRQFQAMVGYLPQRAGAPKAMKVRDFIEYAAWLKQAPDPRSATEAAVERMSLQDWTRKRIGQLSGGTRRRVELAAATVHSPKVLLLDEPTVALDPTQRTRFYAAVKALQTDYILMATHLLEDVTEIADTVHVMHHGDIVWSGAVRTLCGGADPTTDLVRAGFERALGIKR